MKTLEEIDEIIDNPYTLTKEELRKEIEKLQIEIAKKNINDRDSLEDKLDTLLSILSQY